MIIKYHLKFLIKDIDSAYFLGDVNERNEPLISLS